jgi:hypothetical protein
MVHVLYPNEIFAIIRTPAGIALCICYSLDQKTCNHTAKVIKVFQKGKDPEIRVYALPFTQVLQLVNILEIQVVQL